MAKLPAQGTFDPTRPVMVLVTGRGEPLTSTNQTVSVDPSIAAPEIQIAFGFSTDEIAGPGQIFDSVTVSLQAENSSLTAIFLTADVFGVSWAPPSPGAIAVNPQSLQRAPLIFPLLQPDLRQKLAFFVTVPIPLELQHRSLRLYYDLFDNLNDRHSLAWFGTPTIIPEPSTSLLALIGLILAAAVQLSFRSIFRRSQCKQPRGHVCE